MFDYFSNINELDLLKKVYGKIYTTLDILIEFGENLPNWIEIVTVANKQSQKILELQIDRGESSAIAFALETPNYTVILDDYKARKIAEQLAVKYTGPLSIIIKAKQKGIIPSIKPDLQKIKETNFRLSDELENQALKEAGEEYNKKTRR